MPYKSDKIKIERTEFDKRIRLTDAQREEIRYKYSTGLLSQRKLAKEYGVDKKTIYNIVFPEKYKQQLEKYKDEHHSKKYYNKEKNTEYMRNSRNRKNKLYKKGLIGNE